MSGYVHRDAASYHDDIARDLKAPLVYRYTLDRAGMSDLLDEWEAAQATIKALRKRLAPPAPVSHYRPDDF